MALIACPECSHEMSDRAAACPHCGCPLAARPPAAMPPADDTDARLLQALLGPGKIAAVKLCRDLHPGLGLAEAKARVDRLEANLPAGTARSGGGAGCLLAALALLTLAAGYAGHALF